MNGMELQSPPVPRLQITLKAARGLQLVDVRSILHARADTRYAAIELTDGRCVPVFHSLSELEIFLGCGQRSGDLLFLRVHKSHIVAFHHAVRIDAYGLILPTGRNVPVGRKAWSSFHRTTCSIHAP